MGSTLAATGINRLRPARWGNAGPHPLRAATAGAALLLGLAAGAAAQETGGLPLLRPDWPTVPPAQLDRLDPLPVVGQSTADALQYTCGTSVAEFMLPGAGIGLTSNLDDPLVPFVSGYDEAGEQSMSCARYTVEDLNALYARLGLLPLDAYLRAPDQFTPLTAAANAQAEHLAGTDALRPSTGDYRAETWLALATLQATLDKEVVLDKNLPVPEEVKAWLAKHDMYRLHKAWHAGFAERLEKDPDGEELWLDLFAMHRNLVATMRQEFPDWDFNLWRGHYPNFVESADVQWFRSVIGPHPDGVKGSAWYFESLNTFEAEDIGSEARFARKLGLAVHDPTHFLMADPSSPTDMQDWEKALDNGNFWALHAWLDARWTWFRALRGLSDDDPAFLARLADEGNMPVGRHGHH